MIDSRSGNGALRMRPRFELTDSESVIAPLLPNKLRGVPCVGDCR